MGVLRTIAFLAGAAVFMLLAANNLYGFYLLRDSPLLVVRLPAGLFWTGVFLIGALACFLGALMKPKQYRAIFEEPPPPRAAWLDELNKPKQ